MLPQNTTCHFWILTQLERTVYQEMMFAFFTLYVCVYHSAVLFKLRCQSILTQLCHFSSQQFDQSHSKLRHIKTNQRLGVFLSIWKGFIFLMHIHYQHFTDKVNHIWTQCVKVSFSVERVEGASKFIQNQKKTFPLCTARQGLGAFISIFVLLAFSTSSVRFAVCNYCTALTMLSTVRFLKQPCGFSLLWKRHTGNLPVYCWLRLLCVFKGPHVCTTHLLSPSTKMQH